MDSTCVQTTVLEGQTYTLSIQSSASSTKNFAAWIDFNNDGTLEFQFTDHANNGDPIEVYIMFNDAPTMYNTPDHGFIMIGDFNNGGGDEIAGLAINTSINSTAFNNNIVLTDSAILFRQHRFIFTSLSA